MRKHAETCHANKDCQLAIVFFIPISPFSKWKFTVQFSNVICTKTRPCTRAWVQFLDAAQNNEQFQNFQKTGYKHNDGCFQAFQKGIPMVYLSVTTGLDLM